MHGNRVHSTDRRYAENFVVIGEIMAKSPGTCLELDYWDKYPATFSWPGENGSWLIDQNKQFCGLLRGTFGIFDDQDNDQSFNRTMGLVSSVDHILYGIAERAGQDIVVSLDLQGGDLPQTYSVSVPCESK